MTRTSLMVALLALVGTLPCAGQEWATKMFDETKHDFGAVARGSKVEHRFIITNIYEEEIHIAGVRSSCGCTDVEVGKNDLKTWEKTAVIAKLNTRAFLGQRGATLTVTIDRPYYGEVQLHVDGYICSDIVLTPASVDFGTVSFGSGSEKLVDIAYAGRSDWEIVGVQTPHPYLQADVTETNRSSSEVTYQLRVQLGADAPSGALSEELLLLTNDKRATQVPVSIEGRVTSLVSVSPASLYLGALKPGQTITKKLVVRGEKPFSIVGINCDDSCFTFEPSEGAKPLHVIPITFTAGSKAGRVTREIRIETDLGGESTTACQAVAQVKSMDE